MYSSFRITAHNFNTGSSLWKITLHHVGRTSGVNSAIVSVYLFEGLPYKINK